MTGRPAAAIRALLLLFALLASAPPADADETTREVLLRGTAEVSADVIRLGDIADLGGPDTGALAAVVVAYAPGLNLDRFVSRGLVAKAIRERFPFPVTVGGEAQSRVRRTGQAAPCIDPDELKSRAAALLFERRPDLAAAAVRLELTVDENQMPRGACDDLEITLSNTYGDRVTGRLTARFDRSYSRNCLFALTGDVERRLFRARRFLKKGDTVAEEDVAEETAPVPLGGRHASWDQSPVGMVAKTSIREGTVLCADQFARAVCVKKGDKVLLATDKELIQVEIPAQALEDGDVGDTIRVRNKMSGQTVNARVEGAGRVSPAGGR